MISIEQIDRARITAERKASEATSTYWGHVLNCTACRAALDLNTTREFCPAGVDLGQRAEVLAAGARDLSD